MLQGYGSLYTMVWCVYMTGKSPTLLDLFTLAFFFNLFILDHSQ